MSWVLLAFSFFDALLIVVPGFVAFTWAGVVYGFGPFGDGSP